MGGPGSGQSAVNEDTQDSSSSGASLVEWMQGYLGVNEGDSRQVAALESVGQGSLTYQNWCAAFISAGLKAIGMDVPTQIAYNGFTSVGQSVGESEIQVGDIVAWMPPGHVGVAMGGGRAISANFSETVAEHSVTVYTIESITRLNYESASGAPPSSTGTAGGTIDVNPEDLFAIGRAAAVSTVLELPGILNTQAAQTLGGDKSIYNDEPLLPFIQQIAQASMRNFQSLPNGAFFSFFPDPFGAYGHRKPYWSVDNLEIFEGHIELNDEALATHVFTPADTIPVSLGDSGSINPVDMLLSRGIVTIFDAFSSDRIIQKELPPSEDEPVKETRGGKSNRDKDDRDQLAGRHDAENFLRKYGVRPYIEEATFIRSRGFEFLYALHKFMELWSKQFLTTFSFTFMPELYPGGRVAFPDHEIELYIDAVEHEFDYETGFHTYANLSSPTSSGGVTGVSRGMIRADALTPTQPQSRPNHD